MKKSLLVLSLLVAANSFAQKKDNRIPQVISKDDKSTPPMMAELEDTKNVATVQEGSMGKTSTGQDYYVNVSSKERNVIVGYKDNKYALFDYTTKKEITAFIFSYFNMGFRQSNNAIARLDDYYGVINNEGKIIVPFIYDKLYDDKLNDQQVFYVAQRGNKYGVFAPSGEVILPIEYDNIITHASVPWNIRLSKGEKWGFYDVATQKFILPLEYDGATFMYSPHFKVKKNNVFTLFNMDGKQAFSKWYTSIESLDEHTILVEYEGKKGVVDASEKVVIPLAYEVLENIFYSKEGKHLFLAKKNNKWGVVQKNGIIKIPFDYQAMWKYSNSDVLYATKENKRGILTPDGKVLIPFVYDEIGDYEKIWTLKKENKFGAANKAGIVILPVEYDIIKSLNEDMLLIGKNGKKGIIDQTGKTKISCLYDDIITSKPDVYSSTVILPSPTIIVSKGKYGMVDQNGKVVIAPEYDGLQYLNSSLVIALKNGKYGIRTINDNTIVLPFKYSGISYKDNSGVASGDKDIRFRVEGKKIITEENEEQ